MITLGLNAAFHDSAAALVIDGVLVAAAEEERFTRIKHAKRPLPFTAWELPFHAIDFCLRQAGLTLADVDHVAYSFDPASFVGDRAALQAALDPSSDVANVALPLRPPRPSTRRDPSLAAWDSPWDPLFLTYMLNAPRQLASGAPHHLKQRLQARAAGIEVVQAGAADESGDARSTATTATTATSRPDAPTRWHFVAHHLCHQASAFLAAPFERCAVMTLDGRGERATTTYGVYRDGGYTPLGEVVMPHSLGMLYERVTDHLGFLHSSDEYKVMALAAMGQPVYGDALRAAVHIEAAGQFRIDPIDLTALCGPARVSGTPLQARDFDLAASLQQVLESTVLALAQWLREASGERDLAMAGGVALNCVMNARLRDTGPFEAIWIQPAAGDAGTALGAALWADARLRVAPDVSETAQAVPVPARAPARAASGAAALGPRVWTMEHAYLGPEWSDDDVQQLLDWAGLPYERCADDAALVERTAALLAADCIIGWMQGRMEWGPRALGGRSILASPIDPAMQQRLNELKDREDFRPVAPAVLAEAFGDWFTPADANGGRSPYMLFTHQARPGCAERIPSACHSDGSARVQTVHADSHPRFHALIAGFGARTGVPVLVNTSFNVRGEPVVCTPKDALDAFYTTPLDALVIGRFVLRKPSAQRVTG